MINDYCGFCNDAFQTLLDAYQMKEWGISWKEFIMQAAKEFQNDVENWADESVGENEGPKAPLKKTNDFKYSS